MYSSHALLSPPSVNEVNIGGDYEIGRSVRVCVSVVPSVVPCVSMSVYTMTNNSTDVIESTAQAATPAVALTSLRYSEAALPSASAFLVFTSFYLVEILSLIHI